MFLVVGGLLNLAAGAPTWPGLSCPRSLQERLPPLPPPDQPGYTCSIPAWWREGKKIATAKAIVNFDFDPAHNWLQIEDTDGGTGRYVKRSLVRSPDVVHVHWPLMGFPPTLLDAPDGRPSLRQDGPGLPQKAIVRIESPAQVPGPVGVIGAWSAGGDTYDYERE